MRVRCSDASVCVCLCRISKEWWSELVLRMFVRLHHFPPSCRWHVGRVAALRVITDRERARAIVTTTTTASLPLGVPTHVNPFVQAAVRVVVDDPNRFDGRFRTDLLALSVLPSIQPTTIPQIVRWYTPVQTRARWRAERQGSHRQTQLEACDGVEVTMASDGSGGHIGVREPSRMSDLPFGSSVLAPTCVPWRWYSER